MLFVPGHNGAVDRLGGRPSHLPPRFPTCPNSGRELAFLAQFYCESIGINIPNTLCIQLYQDPEVGEGGSPMPVAVMVPQDSPVNRHEQGASQSGVILHDVAWQQRADPESEPDFPDDLPLYASKVGGLCLHSYLFAEGDRFVMQLKEEPGNFNFAGRTCIVCLSANGAPTLYLG